MAKKVAIDIIIKIILITLWSVVHK